MSMVVAILKLGNSQGFLSWHMSLCPIILPLSRQKGESVGTDEGNTTVTYYFIFLSSPEYLPWVPLNTVGCVSVHDMHAVNNIGHF